MKNYLPVAASAAALLCALAVAGYLKWDNAALRRANANLARDIGALETANHNQAAAIAALREDAGKTATALVRAAGEKELLQARARHFERRMQEALKHVATVDVTGPWPVSVRNALCLRWLAAENRLPPDYNTDDDALARNAENDPVARFCAAWDRTTPADTVNWAGALLDHIGSLSIDRNAAATAAKSK